MQPDAVSVPGTVNAAMGCPGDWQPECDQAQLTLDPDDHIWKGTYDLPAGNYFFKVAINRSWDENYGAGAVRGGADIPFTHPGGPVTFYYDHGTHWVTNDVLSEIITAPGSAQSELGCPADWSPDCMRPWLQDPDGDGTWTWTTTEIPAGSYETKVTHGLAWDENYGIGGEPGGANIPYVVPPRQCGDVQLRAGDARPDRDDIAVPKRRPISAHLGPTGSTRGLLAWDLPAEASGWTFRLHAAPTGGLVVDEEAILGGDSFPLTLDPDGLPGDVREQWPHLATYDALRLSRHDARDVDELLTGQLADRGLRRPRTARRRHRRADPRRARRCLRRRLRPRSRGHVARPDTQAGGVGTDGQGRRSPRAALAVRRRTRWFRCGATTTASGRSPVAVTGTAPATSSMSTSTCQRRTRS